ncbi:MAG: hypothetical protein LBL66_10220 [Clostridiales bacterium]|jgi:hypothetical protein|nr:hypothetical protein [Clostridiales bacterium]
MDGNKEQSKRVERDNRKIGGLFIWLNIALLIALYFISIKTWKTDEYNDIKETIVSIEIAMLGCVLTVLAVCFSFLTYKDKESKDSKNSEDSPKHPLLTAENKIWFIDALRLFIIDTLFALAYYFSSAHEIALLFLLVISLLQAFVIFHYYFKVMFDFYHREKVQQDMPLDPQQSKGKERKRIKFIRGFTGFLKKYKITSLFRFIVLVIPIAFLIYSLSGNLGLSFIALAGFVFWLFTFVFESCHEEKT